MTVNITKPTVGASVGSWGTQINTALDAIVTEVNAASSTFAPVGPTVLRAGRRWLFGGDSITNGSSASNFAFSYSRQALHMVGTLYAAPDSIEAGTAGYTSAQLLAQMPGLLSTYTPNAVHLQIGTNDAGQGVPLATFQANIKALVGLCKAAGAAVTIGTVPPRGTASVTTSTRTLGAAYNLWLRLWSPQVGVELAEVHGALADTTTGDMLAAYDSSDGTHPNTLGHGKIAQAVARAMQRVMTSTRPGLVGSANPLNLVPNPLMLSAGTDPTNSFSAVTTGTAPTRSMVADTSGFLSAGQWAQIDLTAAATSAFGRDFALSGGWTVGDTLVIAAQMQVTDVSGGGAWEAAVAAGTASVGVTIINGSSGVAIGVTAADRNPGVLTNGVYNIGPTFMPVVIPAGVTSMTLRYKVDAPSGLHVQARFGALGVFDLTTLGVAPGAAVMVNVDGP